MVIGYAIYARDRVTFGVCMTMIKAALLALAMLAAPAAAQDRGPVTNLPLPRYVSLKASEANVRRGPSMSHRIDWVYQQPGMPLQIIAEHGHWRKVQDLDGVGGWIHYSLLSGNRTAIIQRDILLRDRPDAAAEGVAQFEANVVARLRKCVPDWCQVAKEGYRGWVPKSVLWGVTAQDVFD